MRFSVDKKSEYIIPVLFMVFVPFIVLASCDNEKYLFYNPLASSFNYPVKAEDQNGYREEKTLDHNRFNPPYTLQPVEWK